MLQFMGSQRVGHDRAIELTDSVGERMFLPSVSVRSEAAQRKNDLRFRGVADLVDIHTTVS